MLLPLFSHHMRSTAKGQQAPVGLGIRPAECAEGPRSPEEGLRQAVDAWNLSLPSLLSRIVLSPFRFLLLIPCLSPWCSSLLLLSSLRSSCRYISVCCLCHLSSSSSSVCPPASRFHRYPVPPVTPVPSVSVSLYISRRPYLHAHPRPRPRTATAPHSAVVLYVLPYLFGRLSCMPLPWPLPRIFFSF